MNNDDLAPREVNIRYLPYLIWDLETMQDEQINQNLMPVSGQYIQLPIDVNTTQKNEDVVSRENYGDEFKIHILEQYKLYVEMADRVSSRRVQMASFYTSILSALLALLSITSNKDLFQGPQSFVLLTIAMLGLCLCFVWAANINSYKQLNSLKFKVIHEMETYLPFPCYDREWEILKEDKNRRRYLRLSAVEQYVPFILSVPYSCLLIYSLIRLLNL
ncbi:MAG: hypothetical protein DCF22_22865 [Leptolyngbya sp.]|nr:MAG: hypothetical protein DCF22_22865 [Leptolyngbya sp.]